MLIDGDDGASLDHEVIRVAISWVLIVNMLNWDNVFSYHVGAWGSTNPRSLKILHDVIKD